MKRLWILFPILLAACGGGEPVSDSDTDAASGEVIYGNTRLVDNPPTYESKPLPDGLVWLTNEEDPIYASPEAVRGGTFTDYVTSFPLTLRTYGPNSNSGSFAILYRNMPLSLVDIHPNTLKIVPELATHWAFGDDGKTVYYKLDPRARWSDGEPITADDYVFHREMRLSEHVIDPYGANYFTDEVVDISKYDDYTISVTAGYASPGDELIYSTAIPPLPRHFHRLDENWVEDYNWRVGPTTAPYQITSLEKGRFVEFSRIDDWWGDDVKYLQHRFNPDTVRIEVIRDENVAFEYFMRGELDRYIFSGLPARWYEQATGPDFDRGYIGKIQYYVDVPQPARGLWINTEDPILSDRNVRFGLAHSLNFDRVLQTVFRGDYERLQHTHEGYYWGYENTDIRAREFDLELADQYFDAAGWTDRASDGIRMKDGQRLSVRISYGTDDHTPWLVVLREEARKAGIELQLQLLDPSTWSNQVSQKTFQIVYLSFTTNITPNPWQAWHSDNAGRPDTNNITNTAVPELDDVIDRYDAATTIEERIRLSHEFQSLIEETGAVIPTFKIPYIREAFWRWLKLPEFYATRSSGEIFDPFAEGLFWIDEAARADTLAARREGRTFEPINIVDTTWRTD
ncbi:MAG: extracellular solute-binding protein [Gammaproteobacteria bacterium]|jgi:microcin C transport system substrate-binding protein